MNKKIPINSMFDSRHVLQMTEQLREPFDRQSSSQHYFPSQESCASEHPYQFHTSYDGPKQSMSPPESQIFCLSNIIHPPHPSMDCNRTKSVKDSGAPLSRDPNKCSPMDSQCLPSQESISSEHPCRSRQILEKSPPESQINNPSLPTDHIEEIDNDEIPRSVSFFESSLQHEKWVPNQKPNEGERCSSPSNPFQEKCILLSNTQSDYLSQSLLDDVDDSNRKKGNLNCTNLSATQDHISDYQNCTKSKNSGSSQPQISTFLEEQFRILESDRSEVGISHTDYPTQNLSSEGRVNEKKLSLSIFSSTSEVPETSEQSISSGLKHQTKYFNEKSSSQFLSDHDSKICTDKLFKTILSPDMRIQPDNASSVNDSSLFDQSDIFENIQEKSSLSCGMCESEINSQNNAKNKNTRIEISKTSLKNSSVQVMKRNCNRIAEITPDVRPVLNSKKRKTKLNVQMKLSHETVAKNAPIIAYDALHINELKALKYLNLSGLCIIIRNVCHPLETKHRVIFVTHAISPTLLNSKAREIPRTCIRTFEYLKARTLKIEVVDGSWLIQSARSKQIQPTEDFLISCDSIHYQKISTNMKNNKDFVSHMNWSTHWHHKWIKPLVFSGYCFAFLPEISDNNGSYEELTWMSLESEDPSQKNQISCNNLTKVQLLSSQAKTLLLLLGASIMDLSDCKWNTNVPIKVIIIQDKFLHMCLLHVLINTFLSSSNYIPKNARFEKFTQNMNLSTNRVPVVYSSWLGDSVGSNNIEPFDEYCCGFIAWE